jgi:PAS domain S-box-containing protein
MLMHLPYNPKILIVAEKPDMIWNIAEMFHKTEYIINQAKTGRQCLEQIKNDRPDLVILDIHIKDTNGYEICRQIKSDTLTQNIYVLFLSSDRFTGDNQIKVFEAGADGLITYPHTAKELLWSIHPFLKLIKLEKENSEVLKQLQESESIYNKLVENSADMIAICRNNKVLFINQTGLRMLNVNSIKEIAGKDITSFMVADKKNDSLRRIENSLITGSSYFTSEVFQTSDGNPLPLEIKVIPIVYGGISSILVLAGIFRRKCWSTKNWKYILKNWKKGFNCAWTK